MECKISIVIPVFNAGLFLHRCIDSVLIQSYIDWELLLINDGSEDNSLEICTNYQLQDNRIVIVNQFNSGPSAARNKGISLASGKFLVFVDSDDFVHENYLKKLLEPFLLDEGVELSCGGYLELSKQHKNGLTLHDFQLHLEHATINNQVFFATIFSGITGVLWGKMFVTDIVKKYNIQLDARIKLSEDLLFVFEYVTFIGKIALVKEHLYYYNRLNENGLSRRLNVNNLQDIKLTNEKLRELSSKINTLDFTKVLKKRFVYGILNIIKDICGSKNDLKIKIEDLKFIFSEIHFLKTAKIDLSYENKIYFNLFVKRQFITLIGYTNIVYLLRNLKNKI
jgi:glycosyltransferase involved in cell wall biosynthesis